ncbi:hypothetical protein E8E12_008172 [Didymella heteroderae]|uniref:Uncharacterized protein n=1 Tax=Didymella heteroderae TaxID=1769908 RepID=A0A9P4WNL9_9PLEO|nr:hypothetical protein E8E12_008172 [Didymella heteroderae]
MLAMIHFASWYRNQMDVEFADGLKEQLDVARTGLEAAATFVPEDQLLRHYLNRPYGNAYNFNQADKIEGVF